LRLGTRDSTNRNSQNALSILINYFNLAVQTCCFAASGSVAQDVASTRYGLLASSFQVGELLSLTIVRKEFSPFSHAKQVP